MRHRFVAPIQCFDQRRLCHVKSDECERVQQDILFELSVSFNERTSKD